MIIIFEVWPIFYQFLSVHHHQIFHPHVYDLNKNLAANPVLHPIFCLLLDLHPGGDQIDDSNHDKDDEDNNYIWRWNWWKQPYDKDDDDNNYEGEIDED